MNYPLKLSFKLLAIASQIYVRDANGNLLGYVKQKLFKLKENIDVFADEGQTQLLFNIKADRMLDEANAAAKLNEEPADPAKALAEKYALKETSSVDDELRALKEELGVSKKPEA